MWKKIGRPLRPLLGWRNYRGLSQVVTKSLPEDGTIGLYYNRKHREVPHRTLWRRKTGNENSSWNQCKKSFEALATNFSNIDIGDRVLLIGDCDFHMVNLTLATQKRGAQLCCVPIEGLTTKILEEHIELLRPKVIFLAKDKVLVHDPLSGESPRKMELDLHNMIWKIFPVANSTESMPLRSRRYDFVQNVVLCSEADALNQHDMISNIKYFEVSRDQDYYESPLVHVAMHTSPEAPALSVYADGKWATHTHNTLIRAGYLFASTFCGANERIVLLPGAQSAPYGYLVLYATLLSSGGAICFAEDQLVTAGDCKRVTRSVFLHTATCVAGSKRQWSFLLKHGDAAAKLADPQKKWFESLKWAVLFMEDGESDDGVAGQIKEAFGISRVEIVRGSAETLNFTSYGDDKKLAEGISVVVKDDSGASTSSGEGWVWVKGPHVSPYYQNHIGLMQVPVDNEGFVKTGYRGTLSAAGKGLQITGKQKMKELVL